MSTFANTYAFNLDRICRDDGCDRLELHPRCTGCIRSRINDSTYRTRSKRYAIEPWRAYAAGALRESVYDAVSFVEPRNFATIVSIVENDYGACCERSVHRHLSMLRSFGKIVRLNFRGRIHAYLQAGSRLIRDPDLVLEQIMDLHAEAA